MNGRPLSRPIGALISVLMVCALVPGYASARAPIVYEGFVVHAAVRPWSGGPLVRIEATTLRGGHGFVWLGGRRLTIECLQAYRSPDLLGIVFDVFLRGRLADGSRRWIAIQGLDGWAGLMKVTSASSGQGLCGAADSWNSPADSSIGYLVVT